MRCIPLHKAPGHAVRLYPKLVALLRELKPAIVHTRNLAALEAALPAWIAGVPARLHGEHGRDVGDLDGSSVRYQWVRRLFRPFVTRYVAVSPDLERYLRERVGVPAERIDQIYNGVDTARFRPRVGGRAAIDACPFQGADYWLVGTVGRMEAVKDQTNLARAFVAALKADPEARARLRLVLVGDGKLKSEVEAILESAGVRDLAWFAGERADVVPLLQGLDCFVLPSLAEGVSNTMLEAMACGLPVVATRVGANAELVETGRDRPHGACRRQRGAGARNRRLFRGTAARPAAWTGRAPSRRAPIQSRTHGRGLRSRLHRPAQSAPRPNARARRLPRRVRARDG